MILFKEKGKVIRKIIIALVLVFLCISLFADITSDLIEASKAGDIEKVRQLIEQGVDVNSKDENGWTALIHAVVNCKSEIVSLLIQAGADINVKLPNGMTILIWATSMFSSEIVKLLIQAGADVNASNDLGETALMWAARRCNPQVVELLIEAGADVNAKTTKGFGSNFFDTKPWADGTTALMIASFYAYSYFYLQRTEEVAHLLIQAGADVNAKDEDGRTALIIIIIGEDRSAMGTRIFIKPDFRMINMLITYGANVNIKDNYDKSALDYARELGYSDIEQLLLDAGAEE